MSRKRLRTINTSHLNSIAYRALSRETSLDYKEAPPVACSRLLLEGRADLALIPVADCILHGGYKLLPFGIAANGPTEGVALFSTEPLDKISAILLDSTSRSSAVLIQLLLPRFFPHLASKIRYEHACPGDIIPRIGGETAGMLIGDSALRTWTRFPHRLDLGELWVNETGCPFVFALWALRPEVVDEGIEKKLEDVLARSLKQIEFFARDWAEQEAIDRDFAVHYVTERIRYRIDERCEEGIRLYAQWGADAGFFPRSSAQSISFMSSGKGTPAVTSRRDNLDFLLDEASAGRRISDQDAVALAERARLTELMLAASMRTKLTKHSYAGMTIEASLVSQELPGTPVSLLAKEDVLRRLQGALKNPCQALILRGGDHPELSLAYYRELISLLKKHYRLEICAVSPQELKAIAAITRQEEHECLQELHSAGLDMLLAQSSQLLTERTGGNTEEQLDVHRAAQGKGMPSMFFLPLLAVNGWKERIVHLHKIRQLQEETGLVRSVVVEAGPPPSHLFHANHTAPVYLRAVAISRLYLDNVEQIQASASVFGTPVAELGLDFGAASYCMQC